MNRKCGILPSRLTIACLGKIPHFRYIRFLINSIDCKFFIVVASVSSGKKRSVFSVCTLNL